MTTNQIEKPKCEFNLCDGTGEIWWPEYERAGKIVDDRESICACQKKWHDEDDIEKDL